MKNCSILIIALCLVSVPVRDARPDDSCVMCSLEEGVVRCHGGGKTAEYRDAVLSYSSEGGFYFLRKSSNEYTLMKVEKGSGGAVEKELPAEVQGINVQKMEVCGGTAYFLEDAGTGRLVSVAIESGKAVVAGGVTDFTVLDGVPAVLKKSDDGWSLQGEGAPVPLALKGQCLIRETAAKRFVIVTDGTESEMVDLLAGKSVYMFSAGKELAEPSEYNLKIKAVDIPGNGISSEEMVFYKIYIDGAYAGRTETAASAVEKEYTQSVTVDKRHIVKLERWELDKKSQQYKRCNNIRQPGEQRLYVPGGRIMALDVIYDGKEYRVTGYPVYK